MNRVFFILVLSVLSLASFGTVEMNTPVQDQDATSQVTEAISKGDAAGVVKFFDSSVDVEILEDNGTYSKSQAEQILKTFFSENEVQKFELTHNTSSPSSRSNAFVGWLTANGKRYRLFVQFSESESKKTIQEISIKER